MLEKRSRNKGYKVEKSRRGFKGKFIG